jgi:sugar phosphate isomerase/epimerase
MIARKETTTMLTWGYAGVAHGDLRWWDGDATINKLNWCRRNGFGSTGINLAELADPARRAAVLQAGEGLRLDVGWHADWYNLPAAEVARQGEAFVRELERHREALRCPYVGTGTGGKHRFDAEWPIERQIERVSTALRPTARRLADLGCPLAVHNAFDWWGSDLAAVCRATPGLGVLFDTGNSLVVGERPLDMARHVAPFTVATHIKDHVLFPWTDARAKERGYKGQALVVDGAVLGEGHAEVRAVVEHLLANVRDPAAVIWGWELEPPEGMNGQLAVERSWAVIREIETAFARRTGAGAAACAR